MTDTPNLRTLLRYGLPSLAALAVGSLYSAVDAYFVGTVSVDALAAVGSIVPVLLVTESIYLIVSTGISTVVAHNLGANRGLDAQRAFSAGLLTVLVIGLVQSIAAISFREALSSLFSADENVVHLSARYLLFVMPASFLGGVSYLLAAVGAAQGKPGFGMLVMGIGGILNIGLDYLLISVLGLGVEGAAIATSLSSLVTTTVLVVWLVGPSHQVTIRFVRFRWSLVREQLRIGLPTVLFQFLMVLTIFSLNSIAGRFGVEYVAVVTLVNRIVSVGFLLQYGFARGIQPIVSYHWGSENKRTAALVVRKAIAVGTVLGVVVLVGIGGMLLTSLAGLFGDVDLVFARRMLTWWALTIPFGAVTVSAAVGYMAIGKSLPAAFLILVRQGLLLIPLTIIFARAFGLHGFAVGPATADMLGALVSFVVFRRSVFARSSSRLLRVSAS